MHQQYASPLQQYTQQYKHVVMMGDSMGATAALLFSPLATKVMSFCPQV
jgi:dienelactone hydrolase